VHSKQLQGIWFMELKQCTCIQVDKQLGVQILVKRDSNHHSQILGMVDYELCTRCSRQRFYIFKGEKLRDDYITFYKIGTWVEIQKTMDDIFLFKKFLSFFKQSITSGIFTTNSHLLIPNGHGSHVTLEAKEKVH
jgi:hypothetical protein